MRLEIALLSTRTQPANLKEAWSFAGFTMVPIADDIVIEGGMAATRDSACA